MAIKLNDNIEVRAPKGIDTRLIKLNEADMNSIDSSYRKKGLSIFRLDTMTRFQLRGGTANSNWVEIQECSYLPDRGYTAGEIILQDGDLLQANTTIVAGTQFNPGQWDSFSSGQLRRVIQNAGTDLPDRDKINFKGNLVTVSDNILNQATDVDIELNSVDGGFASVVYDTTVYPTLDGGNA